jgi:hypothetical protein
VSVAGSQLAVARQPSNTFDHGGEPVTLAEWSGPQRREFHKALLEAARFEDPPGKWQAAIMEAEQNLPKLRVVTGE